MALLQAILDSFRLFGTEESHNFHTVMDHSEHSKYNEYIMSIKK